MQFLQRLEIVVKVLITLWVRENGLVSRRLQVENGLLQIFGLVLEARFYQNVVIAEGEQLLAFLYLAHKPLIGIVFRRRLDGYVYLAYPQKLLQFGEFLADNFGRVLVEVAHNVGRGNKMRVARLSQLDDKS